MRSVIAGLLVIVSVTISAEEVAARRGTSPAQPRRFDAPVLRKDSTPVAIATLVDSPIADRESPVGQGGGTRVGVVRPLVEPYIVKAPLLAADLSAWRWVGKVSVPGASGIRYLIDVKSLTLDSVFWVYSPGADPIGFDLSTAHDGKLWSPTVWSPSGTLEFAGRGSFAIEAVADIRLSTPHSDGTECFRDVACQSAEILEDASSVALFSYIKADGAYVCSGALILDTKDSFLPYFLTANHCVSTQAEASSVEAFWDYRAPSCNAAPPSRSSRPRSSGATLLATSSTTDATLLKLSSVPGTRFFLGWRASDVPDGTLVHHVSQAGGGPQVYSSSLVTTTGGTCSSAPRGPYLYSTMVLGATSGGSSGSPAIYGNGQIVGQLRSACGPDPQNPCDTRNLEVDGAFAQSLATLRPWLSPADTPTCAACVPTATAACLLGNRFSASLVWTNRFASPATTGPGKLIRYAENKADVHPAYGPLNEVAYFSFFDHAPNSVDVVVKLFKGVTINDKYWVYLTGFANVDYTVTVKDHRTCQQWQRTNAHGQLTLVTDVNAFAFP